MTMNREEYLNRYAKKLVPLFKAAGYELDLEKVRISVGFPGGGNARTRIGECWSNTASADGTTQIFISPILGKIEKVDHVIVHELVHAVVGNKAGHGATFAKCARAVGLTGKMIATTASPELRERLNAINASVGTYPHAGLRMSDKPTKTQTTRMKKITCSDCGYVLRTSATWLSIGLPTCCCGGAFVADEA